MRLRLLFITFFLVISSCEENQELIVKRITSRAELPGGPKQYGDVGDFLLQNSRIKAVILDAGHSVSPALWGGGLVDLDLVRPQKDYRAGHGLDKFFLLLPMINLIIPRPEKGSVEGGISRDGTRGIVRVTAIGDKPLALLNLLDMAANLNLMVTRFAMRIDYELPKGASYLRITTVFRPLKEWDCSNENDDDNDGKSDCLDEDCALASACERFCETLECPEGTLCDRFYARCLPMCEEASDCEENRECDPLYGVCLPKIAAMEPLRAGTDLTDVLTGGMLKLLAGEPVETRHPGYLAGDMALFGASVFSFAPDIGFEIDTQYRLMFLRGRNSLVDPLAFDFMGGTGREVSYIYFTTEGEVLFPFATESLTGSITHGKNCSLSSDDDEECDNVPFFRFTRYVAVGEGDLASALETVFALRGIPQGRVEGQVFDAKGGRAVSGADVYAILDPCDSQRCNALSTLCNKPHFETYEELQAAARTCTATQKNPDGLALVRNHFRTDRGVYPRNEGKFSGPLTPGRYYLVARRGRGPLSVPVKVEINPGTTSAVALVLPPAATLAYRVFDQAGKPIPARVTIGHCFPECRTDSDCKPGERCDEHFHCRPPSCGHDFDCDHDEQCFEGRCVCKLTRLWGEPLEELGDGYLSDRKVWVEISHSGTGEIALPPGRYDVIFSHGPEYEIDEKEVELQPGQSTFVQAVLRRVVDTSGFISIDQHVHTEGSPDSGVPIRERLVSALADDMDMLVTTDHDYITDPRPVLAKEGLEPVLFAIPGLEISTLDVSHIIGWPLRYNARLSNGGAMNWAGRTPGEIFSWIRANGLLGPEETLVVIAHPRGGVTSYFDVFGLDTFSMELRQGLTQTTTSLLSKENFYQSYDMMEILNSKRFDITRIPTIGEMAEYNRAYQEVLKRFGSAPYREILLRLQKPSSEAVRKMLVRTRKEQELNQNPGILPKCRQPVLCADDKDCGEKQVCTEGVCTQTCNADSDCASGELCLNGLCLAQEEMPCEPVKGLTEDWLRMIAKGLFKPGVGGGDSHGIANFEIGSLRNYVYVGHDSPFALTASELIRAYRQGNSFATYGPFVDMSIGGKRCGEVLRVQRGQEVLLRIRVQSPSWFDVSRVEIFENGQLRFEFDADASDPDYRIAVPNQSVLVLDKSLKVSVDRDSWYVAFAMGIKGRHMSPVYGSVEQMPVYLGDLFAGLVGSLPIELPSYIVAPKVPFLYPQIPFAVTNPIFVDVDGEDEKGCLVTPTDPLLPSWACNYTEDYPREWLPCVCR